MRILHYALGFPPYRTGGLTKFCMDMMQQQKKLGHEVALIWPGQMNIFDKSVKVKYRKEYNGISSFEIINPLPVSYDEGITEIDAFTASCGTESFRKFLKSYHPDVIHVHTLMGLHKEFMEVAKEFKLKTVFTVHDFFTVCPKVTMFREGHICNKVADCVLCPQCNLTALSMKKIFLLQSPIYRKLKDSSVVKKLRKNHRDQYLSGEASALAEITAPHNVSNDYIRLRKYYGEMISLFDTVHCNSSVTKRAFEQYFSVKSLKVISISHEDIRDSRIKKEFLPDKLRLTYLGPGGEAKGFFLLKTALDQLWLTDKTFKLNIYFTPIEISPYMMVHDRYNYSQLESIFQETDVVITPSIWYETFGYTVLEAISHGVPVIISGTVGAKDIIPDGCGVIVEDIDKDKLKNAVQSLTLKKLKAMNENILESANIITLDKMTRDIMKQCY